MRIALVTDSHLAPGADAFNDNWLAVRDAIARLDADLTVHLGDITVDGHADPTQFDHACDLSQNWPTPISFLPGNHDIGDNPPGPGLPSKEPLDEARIADFHAAFGPDYWLSESDAWLVIGLNAQLYGTGTVSEADQDAWLDEVLSGHGGRRIALMLHKPLFQNQPDDAAPHIRYVPLAQRRRLLERFRDTGLEIVLSGHTHQYRDRVVDGVRHLWVPSTAFYLPDAIQERVGEKVLGLGALELSEDGHRFDLVCADGMARNNILDFPVYPEIAAARARLGMEPLPAE